MNEPDRRMVWKRLKVKTSLSPPQACHVNSRFGSNPFNPKRKRSNGCFERVLTVSVRVSGSGGDSD